MRLNIWLDYSVIKSMCKAIAECMSDDDCRVGCDVTPASRDHASAFGAPDGGAR